MAKLAIQAGATSQTVYVFILDSSSTTGAGLTGLAYNTASLTAYYVRAGGTATSITLATQTAGGAYSSGGFVAVDGTNMPGLYRLDLPDAAVASGVRSVVVMLKGAANMAPVLLEIDLNAQVNTTHAAGTAWNSGAIGASTLASDTITAAKIASDAITAAKIATGAIDADAIAADAVTEIQSGLATAADLATVDTVVDTILADTNDIQSRLPAALVGGKMDASVGTLGTDAITAASLAADAVAEIQSGLATAADLATVDTVVDTILADTNDIQTRLPAALVSGRMDASVGAMATDVITATALASSAVAEITGALLATTLDAPRNVSAVADALLTVNDAFHCAIAGAAGKETVVGTTYTVMTPSTGTTIRVFTLDNATTPTSRT